MENKKQKCPTILGVLLGTVVGFYISTQIKTFILCGNIKNFTCSSKSMNNDDKENKNLVFVGVITAEKFIKTRAVAAYETWGQTLPGKITFFSGATSKTNANIPLIRLPGVDDSYPPQKKSFLMLKYMHDHFLEKFEWFMRADDDVYVRGDKLELFLKSINSSELYFIGQAGLGAKRERGRLSLLDDENFCMGGPGMLLTRETLRLVVPHIKYCLNNLYSTHEDVEIGRCIRRFANISCTWSAEMRSLFYHNLFEGNGAFTGNLNQKEIHRAITLHPIKKHTFQYRIHNYMQSLQIQKLRQRVLILMRDINDANKALKDNASSLKEKMDVPRLGQRPSITKTKPQVIPWEFFKKVLFSDTNTEPKHRIEDWSRAALNNVVTRYLELRNRYPLKQSRVFDFQKIIHGYKRLVPSYGIDYILHMLLVYRRYEGRKMENTAVPVAMQRQAFLQQSFTELQTRQLPQDGNKIVNFILPLLGQYETFHQFLEIFQNVCLRDSERVNLLVVLYQTPDLQNETRKIVNHYKSIQDKYPNYELMLETAEGAFSRPSAMQLGASKFQDDDLLFFIDVDMSIDKEFLERTRLNVIRGIQVYFPIVFSQYQYSPKNYYWNHSKNTNQMNSNDPKSANQMNSNDPKSTNQMNSNDPKSTNQMNSNDPKSTNQMNSNDPKSTNQMNSNDRKNTNQMNSNDPKNTNQMSDDCGYWRKFGFGIGAIYKSDFDAVGEFNGDYIEFGQDDVDVELYEKIVKSNLTIFRAVDPGLILIYHNTNKIECESQLSEEQLTMCVNSEASSYAGLNALTDYVYDNLMTDNGTII
uniref:Hexosyltransferase n=1 Tax=Strigamia maritima TaxID=126957 RepID=T1JJS5_STRMM